MKRRFLAVAMAGLLAAGGAVLVSTAGSAATAPNVTCKPGQQLIGGTYNNVVVPSTDNGSNFCYIQGATILGTLTVQSGGAVIVTGASTINNITANGAGTGYDPYPFSVIMCGSTVNGTMSINGSNSAVVLGSDDAQLGCTPNTFNGRTNTVNDNRGGVEISGNYVNGNLSVNDNSGHIDPALDPDAVPNQTTDVSNNSDSTHKLTCVGNAPVVVSTGNTFASYPGGQCGP